MPTITSVSPANGPGSGGTLLTITGTDFLPGTTVTIGGKPAIDVSIISSEEIQCITPSNATVGPATIVVLNGDGTASITAVEYTVTGWACPWNSSDPVYPFTNDGGVSPISVPAAAGIYLSLTYISGLVNNHYSTGNYSDAGGISPADAIPNSNLDLFPGELYISSDCYELALIGGWANSSGDLLAPPFFIGNSAVVGPAPAGTTQLLMGVNDYPLVDNSGSWLIQCNGFIYTSAAPASTGFTPKYPPIKQQPRGCWGLEAKRADSFTSGGLKQSQLDRIDTVTTLTFPFVPSSDLAAWKAFEAYALTGGMFSFRPIADYPNATSSDPMFQYPGTDNGDDATGYSVCQLLSMDWIPKFTSFGNFSVSLKLKLVGDL